ncbi:hypothetical protein HMPREF3039_01523 [Akkermansia sp. KLE1798]|nr:hypothetical protein HMPREF3039_01523 [Akkermansia sp. KLE1798]KZA04726.1 hypothetical protein HMPREF1326_01601 [Akkermansia sp. KLE1605]
MIRRCAGNRCGEASGAARFRRMEDFKDAEEWLFRGAWEVSGCGFRKLS